MNAYKKRGLYMDKRGNVSDRVWLLVSRYAAKYPCDPAIKHEAAMRFMSRIARLPGPPRACVPVKAPVDLRLCIVRSWLSVYRSRSRFPGYIYHGDCADEAARSLMQHPRIFSIRNWP